MKRENHTWSSAVLVCVIFFFFVCVCFGMEKKTLWGTALLIAGPGVLFPSSLISFSFGTIDIQLEWGGWLVGWGGVGGACWLSPRGKTASTRWPTVASKVHSVSLSRLLCVHLCTAKAGRASEHNRVSEELWRRLFNVVFWLHPSVAGLLYWFDS